MNLTDVEADNPRPKPIPAGGMEIAQAELVDVNVAVVGGITAVEDVTRLISRS